jgi:RNA-binding protein 25
MNDTPTGPPVTVFVGNITERAQDAMVRHLLTTCGPVLSWKRVQGATGRLQAFGFCEYANPDAAARAIRTLHDMMVADKKLVVKVDAKTKGVLDEYKRQRRKKMTGKSPTQEENDGSDEDFMDPAMRHEDAMARDRIKAILMDHSKEMSNYVPHEVKRQEKMQRYRDGEHYQTGPKESLDDVEMEDGKRDIIHTEIAKFRETMKIREAEKEAERKKMEKDVPPLPPLPPPRSLSRGKSVDKSGGSDDIIVLEDKGRRPPPRSRSREKRSRMRSRSRSRSFSPSERRRQERSREMHRGSRNRSRSRSRSRGGGGGGGERRSRDRDFHAGGRGGGRGGGEREREREREEYPTKRNSKESWREREKEEEEREKRKEEKKTAQKEASYQERIRKWEMREEKKAKEYTKEKAKELKRSDEQEKEAKKLREFLEDYDDERDDEKFYKSRELERRLNERARESAKDAEDRAKEKEELEELKEQIAKEGYDDPGAELQRRIDVEEKMAQMRAAAAAQAQMQNGAPIIMGQMPVHLQPPPPMIVRDDDDDDDRGHFDDIAAPPEESSPIAEPDEQPDAPPALPAYVVDIPLAEEARLHLQPREPSPDLDDNPLLPTSVPPVSLGPQLKIQGKKKLEVRDVFGGDDDEIGQSDGKKRKPLPPHSSSSKKSHGGGGGGGVGESAVAAAAGSSSDDKRRHIKNLIEKIPTEKSALFEYKVDWDMVDSQLMEKRIRPWVNKKINEYIGEPEPTLTDFICSKVLAGSTPLSVLEDVQMVLDEEAEVFVVKMWRLLIYEIENKKHKAAAATAMSGGGN